MTTSLRSMCAIAFISAGSCVPTSGREVSFDLRLETAWPDAGTPGTFTTETGWTVTLTDARAVVGPVYLFEKPPVGLSRFDPARALYDLVIPAAHAHAGDQHFAGGTVHGEFIEQRVFDLLGAPVLIEGLTGTHARVRSFSVVLFPAREGLDGAESMEGAQLVVAGTATKDTATVRFRGALSIADEGRLRYVDGIPADATLDDGGTFAVRLHPTRWFSRADFSTLTAHDDDDTFEIDRDSQVFGAWFIGARSADAYSADWEAPP